MDDWGREPDDTPWIAARRFVVACLLTTGCFAPGPAPPPASIGGSAVPAAPALPTPVLPLEREGGFASLPFAGHPAWRPSAPLHQWKYIVLHHTASNSGSVATIHESHLQRKDSEGNAWRGIGYHFVIGNGNGMGDGAIEPTFRWREQSSGAHAGVGEYNLDGIGVCLVGDFEESPPTAAQLAAVRRLVAVLKAEHGIDNTRVMRHSDVKATECPGRLFPFAEVAQVAPSR
jgi:hypothetical protein